MIARQIGSPSPAPPVFVEKLGSQIRPRFPFEIPCPVSAIVISAAPFRRDAVTHRFPPSGIAWMEFSKRLMNRRITSSLSIRVHSEESGNRIENSTLRSRVSP